MPTSIIKMEVDLKNFIQTFDFVKLFSVKFIKIISVRQVTAKCLIFTASTFVRPDDARNWSQKM